jgi:nucleoid-associated protein YgaU
MFARIALVSLIALVAWATIVRPSESAGPEREYVVQPADTLWSIATANYAGDPREAVWRLRKRNELAGVEIRPGQLLVLPRG